MPTHFVVSNMVPTISTFPGKTKLHRQPALQLSRTSRRFWHTHIRKVSEQSEDQLRSIQFKRRLFRFSRQQCRCIDVRETSLHCTTPTSVLLAYVSLRSKKIRCETKVKQQRRSPEIRFTGCVVSFIQLERTTAPLGFASRAVSSRRRNHQSALGWTTLVRCVVWLAACRRSALPSTKPPHRPSPPAAC